MDLEGDMIELVREPMVEGIFYPAETKELETRLGRLFSQAVNVPQNCELIVSPHASLEFSGPVMAAAFKSAAAAAPRRIFIVAPCCHSREPAIYLPESALFRTPGGDSRVDMATVQELLETSTLIQKNDLPHLQEHAIEVQLPFIQYLFPKAGIVPILMGNASERVVRTLISGLTICLPEIGPDNLLVVSANLTGILDQNRAMRDAQKMLDLVTRGDWAGIVESVARNEIMDENAGPLAIAAWYARERDPQVVARSNSLSVNYDTTNVVEYAALTL
jgi:AmmeMemoRadiSam system protein B